MIWVCSALVNLCPSTVPECTFWLK
jgi:hypothetical protein